MSILTPTTEERRLESCSGKVGAWCLRPEVNQCSGTAVHWVDRRLWVSSCHRVEHGQASSLRTQIEVRSDRNAPTPGSARAASGAPGRGSRAKPDWTMDRTYVLIMTDRASWGKHGTRSSAGRPGDAPENPGRACAHAFARISQWRPATPGAGVRRARRASGSRRSGPARAAGSPSRGRTRAAPSTAASP